MSTVLNKAQALSVLAKLDTPPQAEQIVREHRPGLREPANAIIARFRKAMNEQPSWMEDNGGMVYGD